MMIRLILLALVLALAACGKYGPNSLPGPADKEIIYRLPYPAQ